MKGSFEKRNILSMFDFNREEIEYVLATACEMRNKSRRKSLEGKFMCPIFFTPSTRTKLSFALAMKRLGGEVIDFGIIETSSVARGESFGDTIKVIQKYGVDIMVIRHPENFAVHKAAELAKPIPVINAGDGTNEHPTQALGDLMTIRETIGRIDGITVAIMGDLRLHRTVHSLIVALANFDIRLLFISPPGLTLPKCFLRAVEPKSKTKQITQAKMIDATLKEAQVLYIAPFIPMFREFYESAGLLASFHDACRSYKITNERLKCIGNDVKILHPLPRHTELSEDIDNTGYAKYFEQVHYGLLTRMALLHLIFSGK